MDFKFQDAKHIHFVGIGGSGMSPLAEILHGKGFAITGSDRSESDNVDRLRRLGIDVKIPQTAENVEGADLIVYTAAVHADNPEMIAANEKNIPILERAKLLGQLTATYPQTIAVAGTHGKTTTTSMLSQVFLEADTDPALFIGGRLPLIDAFGKSGTGDVMVCEACEFMDHYLEMTPETAIILNVDADHLDYFGTLENVIKSFHTFASKATGYIIYNKSDANSCKAVEGLKNAPLISYGLTDDCDWTAKNVRIHDGSYATFEAWHNGAFFADIELGVPGMHNVQNALAVLAAAYAHGLSAVQIASGIKHFQGAGRRFEFLGTFGGITIADDYAHHPTEITATLTTAKAMPYNRVIAIFQPFTFSRTARHLDDFAKALSIADIAIVSDILGSRETNEWNVHSEQITAKMENGVYLADFPAVANYVLEHAKEGDLVITMGGGDVYKCARLISKMLAG